MKLYALAIVALRKTDTDRTEVALQNTIVLVEDHVPIDQYGMGFAQTLFPSDERWEQHVIHPIEIVQGMQFGPDHHLEWAIKPNEAETER